jgi:hypothetical protein
MRAYTATSGYVDAIAGENGTRARRRIGSLWIMGDVRAARGRKYGFTGCGRAALGCACCFTAALAIVAVCPVATTDYQTIIRPDVSLIGGKTREPDGRGIANGFTGARHNTVCIRV